MDHFHRNTKKRKAREENDPNASNARRTRRKLDQKDFDVTALMMKQFNIGKPNVSTKLSRKKRQIIFSCLLTFGDNTFGQIGLGEDILGRKRPALIPSFKNKNLERVACGGQHTITVSADGKVHGFGNNEKGSLGEQNDDESFVPIPIKGFIPSRHKDGLHEYNLRSKMSNQCREDTIVDVKAGDTQSLALSKEGNVFFFGSYYEPSGGKDFKHLPAPDDSRLIMKNHGLQNGKDLYKSTGTQRSPLHVYQLDGRVLQIECGSNFNAALVQKIDSNGNYHNVCMTFGIGESGFDFLPIGVPQSGKLNSVSDEYLVPRQVKFQNSYPYSIEKIACGSAHLLVVARDDDGKRRAFSCGLNGDGQLGHTINGVPNTQVNLLTKVRHTIPHDMFKVLNITRI